MQVDRDIAASVLATPDRINLRAWFAFFLVWMISLAAVSQWALAKAEATGSTVALASCLLALYAVYLSLCCTFFPMPTTGMVLLVSSNEFAAMFGIHGHSLERLIIVAALGAASTGLANLNEYHLFTYLLRHGRIAKVRNTKLYITASRWFSADPFWVISLFSFIPIPVDVIRWLAITYRYSRWRFFWASFTGRLLRYAGWCAASIGLDLTPWQILWIQLSLVALVIIRLAPKMLRQIHGEKPPAVAAKMHTGTMTPPIVPAIVGPPLTPYNPPDPRGS